MTKFPPNYTDVFATRQTRLQRIKNDPSLIKGALAYYENNFIALINDWFITHVPGNAMLGIPTILPFILFKRQEELVRFVLSCLDDLESGLIDKSRKMGVTWLCCAISICLWRFRPGISIGWMSKKEKLVDRLGDPGSIFEKMRMIIKYLPRWLWPPGFIPKDHMTYMKIVSPKTNTTIIGDTGDDPGRGGRTAIYFKDESAHYEHPESVEAGLCENTDVQIDISTVHGTANLYHRKRQAGKIWTSKKKIEPGVTRVFIFDWRDHPQKTVAWYRLKRKKYEAEGNLHVFAQEIDRDASASIEGILIPAQWVKAAIDAHKKLRFSDDGKVIGALDVADEGGDKNAFGARKGVILKHVSEWAEGDTGQTADRAVAKARQMKVSELQYDCIGVGAGVKAETNRLRREGILTNGLSMVPWNAASAPLFPRARVISGDPDSIMNKDFYANLKAQAYWMLRTRFEKTYRAITKAVKYDAAELISIPAGLRSRHDLEMELSQPIYRYDGKCRIIIEKKPDGARSPNLADMTAMLYWPIQKQRVLI